MDRRWVLRSFPACTASARLSEHAGRAVLEKKPIMLVRMPPFLRDLVRTFVSAEPDLSILEGDEAETALRTGGACLAITHLDDPAPASLAELLGTRLHVRVIGLSADGRNGTVYDVQLQQRSLGPGEISLAELLAAIREPITASLTTPKMDPR
jgi:hypothetical protein